MKVIIKPILTEKLEEQTSKLNRVGFIVEKTATKDQIKRAVKELYDVEIVSINTAIYGGKMKSRHTKSGLIAGKTKAYKKAYVTLAEGQTIDFYSNI
jgi:large subunit ribosomal protein L23